MGFLCWFSGHSWIYSGHEEGRFGDMTKTYHNFRQCKRCKCVEKSFNHIVDTKTSRVTGEIVESKLNCDWTPVDPSELVAEKI